MKKLATLFLFSACLFPVCGCGTDGNSDAVSDASDQEIEDMREQIRKSQESMGSSFDNKDFLSKGSNK